MTIRQDGSRCFRESRDPPGAFWRQTWTTIAALIGYRKSTSKRPAPLAGRLERKNHETIINVWVRTAVSRRPQRARTTTSPATALFTEQELSVRLQHIVTEAIDLLTSHRPARSISQENVYVRLNDILGRQCCFLAESDLKTLPWASRDIQHNRYLVFLYVRGHWFCHLLPPKSLLASAHIMFIRPLAQIIPPQYPDDSFISDTQIA